MPQALGFYLPKVLASTPTLMFKLGFSRFLQYSFSEIKLHFVPTEFGTLSYLLRASSF